MTITTTTTEAPRAKRKRKRGRGSIYKRKDGLWCGEMQAGGGARRFVYGKTMGEVEQKLTAEKATLDAGGTLSNDTIGALLDRFLEERKSRVRTSTWDGYDTVVRLHIKPAVGTKTARTFSPADVQAFIAAKQKAKATPQQIHTILVVLRMALKLAVKWGLVMRNAAEHVRGPKIEQRDLKPLDAADAQKLLEKARDHELGAIWFITASLGLRRGEVLGLTWADVDLDTGALHVSHQLQGFGTKATLAPPKTKSGARELQMGAGVVAMLKARKALQAADKLKAGDAWLDELGLIFTTANGLSVSGCHVHRVHAALCKAAEVRAVRFHDLRHGAATLMLGAGVDPVNMAALLGHRDAAFTLMRYAHATKPKMADAAEKLAGVLGVS
jgi:integrase